MEISGFQFLTPLVLRRERTRVGAMGDEFLVQDRYAFSYARDGLRITRTCPSYLEAPDFTTDGASVPEVLQWAIKKFGPHLEASFCHDVLYWFGRRKWRGFEDVTREEADRAFLAALEVSEGVSDTQAYAMFEGVRVFGATVWNDGTDWGIDVPDTDPERPMDLG